MFFISINKLESRRSGEDRRKSENAYSNGPEKRTSKERRTISDRRSVIGRRSGMYRILSSQQKEKLDRIINIRDVEISDLVIG